MSRGFKPHAAKDDPIWDRVTMSVEEAAKALGVGRKLAYDAVRSGEIPSYRLGRRILVLVPALRRILWGEVS